ncbi:MAG: DUF2306 domain-containing protein [Acidobacteria bacterium]|nr:DUF2306 domain-containing protein [Acidobacteriota bacterium]
MSIIGAAHTLFGLLALGAGGAVLFRRKGTSSHRRLGRVYVLSMVGLLSSSFLIYRLFGRFGPFHVLSVIAFISLAAGFLPAWTRRPRQSWVQRHYQSMSYSYAGLVAATAAEIAVRLPGARFAFSTFLASAVVIVIATLIIQVRRRRTISPFIG